MVKVVTEKTDPPSYKLRRRIGFRNNYCKRIFLLLCPAVLLTFNTYRPLLSS